MSLVFGAALLAAAGVLAALVFAVDAASRASIVDVTERLARATSLEITRRVEDRLRVASETVREFEAETAAGVVRTADADSVQRALLGAALRRPELAEVAFTYGRFEGRDAEGRAVLAAEGRGQCAVERRVGADEGLFVRRTSGDGGRFVARISRGEPPRNVADSVRMEQVPDPTTHLTFVTPASAEFAGRPLWSDLHRSQLDAALPEPERRVVVTVQKSIAGPDGDLAGVLRVSLTTARLDAIAELARAEGDTSEPPQVVLCDRGGRLIAPAGAGGRLEDTEDGLRVAAADVPAPVARALALPALAEVPRDQEAHVTRLELGGRTFLAACRAIPSSQDWIVCVLVPEDAYAADLERSRRRLLAGVLGVAVLLLAGGTLALRAAGRSFGAIVRETERMRAFDFAPSSHRASVREVQAVLDGAEHAKSALRALSKFVPVDLVRRLYADGGDPRPGGELRELSVLFSDIEGFTTFSESLAPDVLAGAMALYFEAMTRAIHGTGGVVDKFVGDAVMALWNAPESAPDHAVRACRAALACREAERALLASPAWAGRPAIRTRIGIHTGVVLVGNIGAPDRLNFTALGDGVNLASRVEGLNKHYGTATLVTEAVVAATAVAQAGGAERSEFAFRLLDRVAVKGRAGGVAIYELLGPRVAGAERPPAVARYDEALAAYFRREFTAAAELLAGADGDPPSRVLRARCLAFADRPPPASWDGTHVHGEK